MGVRAEGGLIRDRGSAFGPTVTALVLAVATLPLTVLAMTSGSQVSPVDPSVSLPMTLGAAFVGSIGAMAAGALVGGAIGGLVVRERPVAGALVAIATAQPAAILGFVLLNGLFGRPVLVPQPCMGGCAPVSLSGTLSALVLAARAYLVSVGIGGPLALVFVWWISVPAAAVALLVHVKQPRNLALRGLGAIAAIVLVGLVNWGSIGASGWSFVVLALGACVWAAVLAGESAEAPPWRREALGAPATFRS